MSAEETIPQQRERIDAQNKQIAGLRKQNQELRTEAAKAVFGMEGYNQKHAELFVTQTAEDGTVPTPETVAAFAGEWDLAKIEATGTSESGAGEATEQGDEQDDSQSAPGSKSLDAMSRSGSGSGDGSAGGAGDKTLTRQEWIELTRTDKAAAETALRQGRVQLSGNGPTVGNPYAASQ